MIPNGYRLITKEDIGRTFGVELNPILYFDTTKTPTTSTSYLRLKSGKTFQSQNDSTHNAWSYLSYDGSTVAQADTLSTPERTATWKQESVNLQNETIEGYNANDIYYVKDATKNVELTDGNIKLYPQTTINNVLNEDGVVANIATETYVNNAINGVLEEKL